MKNKSSKIHASEAYTGTRTCGKCGAPAVAFYEQPYCENCLNKVKAELVAQLIWFLRPRNEGAADAHK